MACDSKKNDNPVTAWVDCQLLATCYQENTRFGMIGDSWTDFAFGTALQRDMYDWLITEHAYKITATNIAGQTINTEVNQQHSYLRVIKNAGPEINFMLLSLGGNDLLNNSGEYSISGVETVKNQRFALYETNLRKLILNANAYKIDLYGGKPLKWVIHGYDYSNPELISQCDFSGFTIEEKKTMLSNLLNDYNVFLQGLTFSIQDLYYIDLRGTLGGPPISNPALKFDCIHPTEIGFQMITQRYVNSLQLLTQEK